MLKKKEIASILIVAIVLAFVISLVETIEIFLYTLLTIAIIIVVNIAGKKIAGHYYDTNVKIKLWEIKRYGYKVHHCFKKPFPMGIVFPFITTALTFGWISWMGCLVFDVKAKVHKAARRHKEAIYSFSDVTEWQTGIIATWGLAANLLASIVGVWLGFPEFASLSIFYAFYNVLPISSLDGKKMLFAHELLWAISAAIILASVFLII